MTGLGLAEGGVDVLLRLAHPLGHELREIHLEQRQIELVRDHFSGKRLARAAVAGEQRLETAAAHHATETPDFVDVAQRAIETRDLDDLAAYALGQHEVFGSAARYDGACETARLLLRHHPAQFADTLRSGQRATHAAGARHRRLLAE